MTLIRRVRRRARIGPGLVRAGLVVATLGAAGALGLAGPAQPASAATVLQPPSVPQSGAYVGAWVAPSDQLEPQLTRGISEEADQLDHFEAAIGRPLGFVHVFQSWTGVVENRGLNALSANGAIPMIDWAPPSESTGALVSIIDGQDDAQIVRYADQLIRYGRPVFLRWFWEFNFPNSSRSKSAFAGCHKLYGGTGTNAECFVAAWQRIYWIFKGNPAVDQAPPGNPPPPQGAYNVAFAWCPGIGGAYTIPTTSPYISDYYPGDNYVDWIGIDGYDRQTAPSAGGIDQVLVGSPGSPSNFYATWATHDKPMMLGETGAPLCTTGGPQNSCTSYSGDVQSTFLADLETQLPTQFPLIHAVGYFDTASNATVWTLQNEPGSPGLTAFASMLAMPYFSFIDP
jgi:hypothetical protein